MTNFDDYKAAIEGISGGKNTVVLDKYGLPSVVVPIPKMTCADVITGGSANVLPAFMIDGVEKPYFCMGKYQDTLINGVPYSLPMQAPAVSVNFDNALAQSRSKGVGWCLVTNAMWAAVALWCRKNGFMPRGNNNYGADTANAWEKGVAATVDSNGKVNATLTGSGPVSWNHNNDITGICDMNGNVWEWQAGMRLVAGEIQIIPYNNAAMANADMGANSTWWKAIMPDGTLVEPGTAGTLKYDYVGNKVRLCTTITSQADSSRGADFATSTLASGITCPEILKSLALFPADNGDHGGDAIYMNNGAGLERLPFRGGSWYNGANAGVFRLHLNFPRSSVNTDFGRRSAFVGTL